LANSANTYTVQARRILGWKRLHGQPLQARFFGGDFAVVHGISQPVFSWVPLKHDGALSALIPPEAIIWAD
jgi:hypothetical protein